MGPAIHLIPLLPAPCRIEHGYTNMYYKSRRVHFARASVHARECVLGHAHLVVASVVSVRPASAPPHTHSPTTSTSSYPPAPLLHREQILCSGHIAPRGDLDLCATAAATTTTTTITTTTITSIQTIESRPPPPPGCVNAQFFCASWDLPQSAAPWTISLTSYGLQPPQSDEASPPPPHGRSSAFLSHPAWSRT